MKTQPAFQNTSLDVRTRDGLDDELLGPLVFLRANGDLVRAPLGGTTDGLSVPRCVQNIIPATGGDWFSGVLHDSAYRNQLEVQNANGNWGLANYPQRECDDLILEAMKSQQVSWIMRQIIYRALRVFGGRAFTIDRSAKQTPGTP